MKIKEITVLQACIVVSLILWLLSINQIPVYDYTVDPFWYVKNIPIFYWVGLVLTFFTAFRYMNTKETKKKIYELTLIVLFTLYLFGTLRFATNNPYYLDIYGHVSQVKVVEKFGNIFTPAVVPHFETPGSGIFFTILSQVVGHDFFDIYIVDYYSIFVMIMISILVYLTAKHFSAHEKALIAPITFLSFAFFDQFHISRQSFSLILFSILLLSMSASFKSRKIQWPLIFIITNISLLICHPGVPIFFSISLAFALLLMNLPWFKSRISKPKKNLTILLLFGIVVYFCWRMYFPQALPWFEDQTLLSKRAFENLFSAKLILKPERLGHPSYEFGVVILIRETLLLLEIAVGILSIVFLWISRVKDEALFLGGCLAGFLFLLVLLLFGYAYLDRPFLFALFPIAILCALSFAHAHVKKWKGSVFQSFLVVILVTSMILIPISGYGANLPFECPSSSEIYLASFVKESLPNGTSVSGIRHAGLIEEAVFSGYLIFYLWNGSEVISSLPKGCDVIIMNFEYNYYKLRFGSSRQYEKLENETLAWYNKVYDSGMGKLYETTDR